MTPNPSKLDALIAEGERMVKAGASPGGLDSIEVQMVRRLVAVVRRQRNTIRNTIREEKCPACQMNWDQFDLNDDDCEKIAAGEKP